MKNIFTKSFFISVFFLLSILLISYPVKAQDKGKEDEVSNLKDKVEMLEKKLQKQEDEISRLQKEVDELKEKGPSIAVPELRNNKNFRKGKPFEFNGELYYMIPLNKDKIK